MFSFKITGSITEMQKQLDIQARLDARRVVAPEVYDEVCFFESRWHCSVVT
jgi:hydroxymethylglutaryl-CoA synthase